MYGINVSINLSKLDTSHFLPRPRFNNRLYKLCKDIRRIFDGYLLGVNCLTLAEMINISNIFHGDFLAKFN